MRAAVLIFALCAGCAEVPPPAVQVIAPRHAGGWQQFCEQAASVPQASALVGARGAEGFELVAMYNGVLCYKRPAPEPAPPRPRAGAPPTPPTMPVFHDPGF